ncbi:MAG TPA: polyketide synthase dehydratase domain-containing protein, partial [Kofleriaceae bacterium]|nr:polyketide synthase dehydratase domain-containing protein [Kofleriaceae bacterium]
MENRRSLTFEFDFTRGSLPYLEDHAVDGQVVFPAAAYLEMILAGTSEVLTEQVLEIQDAAFLQALVMGDGRLVTLRIEARGDGVCDVRVESQPAGAPGAEPQLHATAVVIAAAAAPGGTLADPRARVQTGELRALAVERFYEAVRAGGVMFGPSFRGVRELWANGEEAIAHVALPPQLAGDASMYRIHPALLDACLQPGFAIAQARDPAPALLLP